MIRAGNAARTSSRGLQKNDGERAPHLQHFLERLICAAAALPFLS